MPSKKFFISFFFILVIALISCTKKDVNDNSQVLKEITKIESLSVPDDNGNNNLTVQDLSRLKELLKDDRIGQSYERELEWLVSKNESQHILHLTLYMREYLETGVDSPCLPHELWHVSLFLKHNDMGFAKNEIKNLDEDYKNWVKSVEKKKEKFPQYYLGFDEQKKISLELIEKLKKNDFGNQTQEELATLGDIGIC